MTSTAVPGDISYRGLASTVSELDRVLAKYATYVTLEEMVRRYTQPSEKRAELFVFRIPKFDPELDYHKVKDFLKDVSPFSRPAASEPLITNFHQHLCVLRQLKLERTNRPLVAVTSLENEYDWRESKASVADLFDPGDLGITEQLQYSDLDVPLWLTYDWRLIQEEAIPTVVGVVVRT